MATSASDGVAAIILAGELSKNRNSLDSAGPRSLLTVGHSRWLNLVVEGCVRAGVSAIAVCVTELSPLLLDQLHSWSGQFDLRILVDGVPRGSAGCCRDAAELFDADAFVIVEGSILPRLPVAELLTHHRCDGAVLTLAVAGGPTNEGRPENSAIHATPVGLAVVSGDSVREVPEVGFHDLKEGLIPRLLAAERPISTLRVGRDCPRIRDLESYLGSQRLLLADTIGDGMGVFEGWGSSPRRAELPSRWPGVEFVGPVLVASDAQISAGAILVGPCVIGPGCSIASAAVVAGSVVREGCRIGSRSIVRHSLLLPGSTLGSGVEHDREILRGAA